MRKARMVAPMSSGAGCDWDDLPAVLQPRHLVRILAVSDATVYELNHTLLAGIARKVGRQWRYPKSGLRRLIEGVEATT